MARPKVRDERSAAALRHRRRACAVAARRWRRAGRVRRSARPAPRRRRSPRRSADGADATGLLGSLSRRRGTRSSEHDYPRRRRVYRAGARRRSRQLRPGAPRPSCCASATAGSPRRCRWPSASSRRRRRRLAAARPARRRSSRRATSPRALQRARDAAERRRPALRRRRCSSPGSRSAQQHPRAGAAGARRAQRHARLAAAARPPCGADRRLRRPHRRSGRARLPEAARRARRSRTGAPSRSLGNFYERHQPQRGGAALYQRFADSDQGMAVVAPGLAAHRRAATCRRVSSPRRRTASPRRCSTSPASSNQRETIDALADLCPARARAAPDFPLAQLLVAEILDDAEARPAEALARLSQRSTANRPLPGRRGCASPPTLDALDRTDEAVGELKAMAAERPDGSRAAGRARRHPARATTASPRRSTPMTRRSRASTHPEAAPLGAVLQPRRRARARRASGRAPRPICSTRSSCSRSSRWCSTISAIPGSTRAQNLERGAEDDRARGRAAAQ